MSARGSSSRRFGRLALLAGAGSGLGLALAQRHHVRAMAADPDLLALSAPLGGAVLDPVLSADGTRLHAERFGADDAAATLVLAHGWTEDLTLWGPVIRRLAGPQLRIVAYDLRGHGSSEVAAGGDYSIDRFGEDLAAVIVAAGGAPARTTVAGHSLGAMSIAAWGAVVDVAEQVSGVAFVNTGLSELLGGALILGELGARITPERVSRSILSAEGRMLPSTPLSLAVTRHVAFGPDASDGTVAFLEKMVAGTDSHARGATGLLFSTLDVLAAASRISVPALVIAGDRDRLTPAAHARRLEAALPHPVGLQVLERTGHMSPLERPDAVTQALRSLLAQTHVPA